MRYPLFLILALAACSGSTTATDAAREAPWSTDTLADTDAASPDTLAGPDAASPDTAADTADAGPADRPAVDLPVDLATVDVTPDLPIDRPGVDVVPADVPADRPVPDAAVCDPAGHACRPYFCGCGRCDPAAIQCVADDRVCPLDCVFSCPELDTTTCRCEGGTCQRVVEPGACTMDTDCPGGQLCCYPCGIPGCTNRCTDPGPDGHCPLRP
jgi:hypothetical protein